MLIGIDPGHGGYDPGAIGRIYGTKEKDITLAISTALSAKLKSKGITTYMTRSADVAVSDVRTEKAELNTRTTLLNNMKCDVAVSVHVNSSPNSKPNYLTTCIQATGGEAEKLAEKVQGQVVRVTGWKDNGVKVQNLAITRQTKMPAILVECGFISNAAQEEQLRQDGVRIKIANAIANGIMEYLAKEAGPVTTDEALKVLKDKGVITDVTYWAQVVNCVKYMDALVVNVAEKLK